MSRWRRRRKAKPLAEEPHMRGARMWLQDLRELCEMSFDNHIEGQRKVREMQIEWLDAHKKSEISDLKRKLDSEQIISQKMIKI